MKKLSMNLPALKREWQIFKDYNLKNVHRDNEL